MKSRLSPSTTLCGGPARSMERPKDIGDALRRRNAGKELQKDSKHQCQKPHQPSAHSAKA
jgi:hypothetical protein